MINNALQINGIVFDVNESSTCTSYKVEIKATRLQGYLNQSIVWHHIGIIQE